mmetsp:Transcript_39463/g.51653  ORF Transcript_39463/g.51653 Transcript_39463/m.51653 type:complete len:128 (+) Transcript_39463:169-552(+)
MLLLILISFVNFTVLLTMLGFEFKRLGCHWSSFKDKKVIIFIILAVMQFFVFFHYGFATQISRIFLQTFEEGCRTLVFFLTMNFYIKMCSKLLKKREWWLKIFRVLWNISLSLFILVELYVVIAVAT